MNDQINAIINNLCEKFGTTTQFLIPEIAKYEIAVNVATIVTVLVLDAICVVLAKKCYVAYGDSEKDPYNINGWQAGMLSCIVIVVIATIVFVPDAFISAIGWIASPYGAFVNILTRMLK